MFLRQIMSRLNGFPSKGQLIILKKQVKSHLLRINGVSPKFNLLLVPHINNNDFFYFFVIIS